MKADFPDAATDLKLPGSHWERPENAEQETHYCRVTYTYQAGGSS